MTTITEEVVKKYVESVKNQSTELDVLKQKLAEAQKLINKLSPKRVKLAQPLNEEQVQLKSWKQHLAEYEADISKSNYLTESRDSALSEIKTCLFNLLDEEQHELELMASKSRSLPVGVFYDLVAETSKEKSEHNILLFNVLHEIAIGHKDDVIGEDFTVLKEAIFKKGLDAKELVKVLKKELLPSQAKKAVKLLRKARASADSTRILDAIAGVLAHILSDNGMDLT